jgi:hypothetical protein
LFKGIHGVNVLNPSSVQGTLQNAVFILDEVQFLVGATASTERGYVKHYRLMKTVLTNHRDPATTWVFAATATPGTNFAQFKDILNIVRGKPIFSQFTINDLKTNRDAKSLISYVNMAGNRAQFAAHDIVTECVDIWSNPVYGHKYYLKIVAMDHISKKVRSAVKTYLAAENQRRYDTRNGKTKGFYVSKVGKNGAGDVALVPKKILDKEVNPRYLNYNADNPDSNPQDFYAHLRRNAMYQSVPVPLKMQDEDIRNVHVPFNPRVYTLGTREKDGRFARTKRAFMIGPKITMLLQRIKENPSNLHYVYVTDPISVKLIAYLLVRDLKMTMFRTGRTPSPNGTFGFVNERTLDDSRDKFKQFNVWTSVHVREVIKAASSENNRTGRQVRVLLATKDAFKGVDVGNIRHLHLLDPMADFQQFVQFIGRGPRFCSHKHFSKMASRRVLTHVYRIKSSKLNVDPAVYADHITWERAWKNYEKQWGAVLNVVEDIAVDAPLFKPTFHKAFKGFLQGLHDRPCTITKSTFERVSGAKAVRRNNSNNNSNNNNNYRAAMNNNNNNFNAANVRNANKLQKVKLVNLSYANREGRSRMHSAVKALVNDNTAAVKRFVTLQRKMQDPNIGVTNAERGELLNLQRAVQNKHKGIFS